MFRIYKKRKKKRTIKHPSNKLPYSKKNTTKHKKKKHTATIKHKHKYNKLSSTKKSTTKLKKGGMGPPKVKYEETPKNVMIDKDTGEKKKKRKMTQMTQMTQMKK